MSAKGLRNGAMVTFVLSMGLLLVGGYYAKQKVPPIPARILSGGTLVTDRTAILRGQDVYQRYGLMDHGSVWGHGSLRGMDFSADSLHRMGQLMREFVAAGGKPRPGGSAYEKLAAERRREIDVHVIDELRVNRYDPATDTLEITPAQAYALEQLRGYWDKEFGEGDARYGFLKDTVSTAEQRKDIADFFFWTAWAAGTPRPGLSYSYTNNWPSDRSVGNFASTEALVWSIGSLLSLLSVLGVVVYVVHRYGFFYGEGQAVQAAYRLLEQPVTPSQLASAKFFLVAGLLFVVQIFNGGLLAHYTVHPGSFYVKLVGEMYPYSWAKTWHLQLAILWIAISWMGTAVYLAPLVARREPARQRLLVDILFLAAVLVTAGSMLGEVLGIKGYLGEAWFWLGHQGWEYLELGRLWQILLFAGLIYWVVVVYRALAPALRKEAADADTRALLSSTS